jgi:hypothetical protein
MKLASVTLLLLGCGGEVVERLPAPPEPRFDFGCPNLHALACTGLYGEAGEHWYSKQLGEGVEPFRPGTELWSDHMEKQRFVWLPAGSAIDTTDADAWIFPLGTKFWKEFSYQGKRIETRYLERASYGWYAATFRWSGDESSATLLTDGERNVPGTFQDRYEVPATRDCARCHGGAEDHILGFGALLMSDESAQGLTVQKLRETGKLSTELPDLSLPGTAVERAALSYLHVNCGLSCHNPSFDAEAWWTSFYLRLEVGKLGSVAETAAYRTGVGKESYIVDPSRSDRYLMLIAPGQPEQSAVVYRDSQRDSRMQMPPLGTHSVDEAGLAAVKVWIQSLAPP